MRYRGHWGDEKPWRARESRHRTMSPRDRAVLFGVYRPPKACEFVFAHRRVTRGHRRSPICFLRDLSFRLCCSTSAFTSSSSVALVLESAPEKISVVIGAEASLADNIWEDDSRGESISGGMPVMFSPSSPSDNRHHVPLFPEQYHVQRQAAWLVSVYFGLLHSGAVTRQLSCPKSLLVWHRGYNFPLLL